MLRPSRRDQLALESLLPFIDREITADPEQRDPARRAARRQEVSQATLAFKNLRAEEEERKDRELRAKLNGGPRSLTCGQVTDVSELGVPLSPHIPSRRVEQHTTRPAVRAEAKLRPPHPDHSEQSHRVLTHRTALMHIASMYLGQCIPCYLANVLGQILAQSTQQAPDLR